jgi:class 3 adenylate cyclase/Tol biopolymer transport system component
MSNPSEKAVSISHFKLKAVEKFGEEQGKELLTILFTDQVNSVQNQSELGNEEAARLTKLHRAIVREKLDEFNAREIEWAGDSCLAVFAIPSDAVIFALQLQVLHQQLSDKEPSLPQVRIGIHLGEVVVTHQTDGTKKEDLFGVQVSETARIMSIARGGQVFCTRAILDSARGSLVGETIEGGGDIFWERHGQYMLKGSEEPLEVCEVGVSSLANSLAPESNDKCRPVTSESPSAIGTWKIAVGVLFGLIVAILAMRFAPGLQSSSPNQSQRANLSASAQPQKIERISLSLPESQPLAAVEIVDSPIALSSDGTILVYNANINGSNQIVVRSFSELSGRVIPGSTNTSRPSVSPDDEWISFIGLHKGERTLLKARIGGGEPIPVAGVNISFPMVWSEDGESIIYTPRYGSGLLKVSANGGEPEVLTTLEEGENGHAFPVVLPGRNAIIYTSFEQPNIDTAKLKVIDFENGETKVLLEKSGTFAYLPTGHLIFTQLGVLRAVAFDLDALDITGDPFDVTEKERMADAKTILSRMALSRNGTLAYVPYKQKTSDQLELSLFNINGTKELLSFEDGDYSRVSFSPDGRYVAVSQYTSDSGRIEIIDLEKQSSAPFMVSDSIDGWPLWTSDGKEIIFSSVRSGGWGLYAQNAQGTGEPRQLYHRDDSNLFASWVSKDGSTMIYNTFEGDVFEITLADGEVRELLNNAWFEEGAVVSKNEQWIAYQSDESGQMEVYVRSYPEMGTPIRISKRGGERPLWSPDEKYLYYRSFDSESGTTGGIMRIEVKTSGQFQYSDLEELFSVNAWNYWDIHPDGDQFLMMTGGGSENLQLGGSEIILVKNWLQVVENKHEEISRHQE